MKKLTLLTIAALFTACTVNTPDEISQKRDTDIISVKDKIVGVDTLMESDYYDIQTLDSFLLMQVGAPLSNQSFLTVCDLKNYEKLGELFPMGHGAGEYANLGGFVVDEKSKLLYITDFEKFTIYGTRIDSMLNNPDYKLAEKRKLDNTQFPDRFTYINDSLCIATMIFPGEMYGFQQALAKYNMATGKFTEFDYKHPDVGRKRICATASEENNLCVECYRNYDLITLYDLEGNVKCNICGPDWNPESTEEISYFDKVIFANDKIIASYSGRNYRTASSPTKLFVYDTNGKYLKTLDVGSDFANFCYDKTNNRIILLNIGKFKLAYIPAEGLL